MSVDDGRTLRGRRDQSAEVTLVADLLAGLRRVNSLGSRENRHTITPHTFSVLKTRAISSTLEVAERIRVEDPSIFDRTRIKIGAFVLDQDEQFVPSDSSLGYLIYVVFPEIENRNGAFLANSHVVARTREGGTEEVDRLIVRNADLRPVEPHHRQGRLYREIQLRDYLLRGDKKLRKNKAEKLEREKHECVRKFLEVSQDLPFSGLFRFAPTEGMLYMRQLRVDNLIPYLLDRDTPARFKTPSGPPTGIPLDMGLLEKQFDMGLLEKQYRICQSGQGSPEDQKGARLYEIFFLGKRKRSLSE